MPLVSALNISDFHSIMRVQRRRTTHPTGALRAGGTQTRRPRRPLPGGGRGENGGQPRNRVEATPGGQEEGRSGPRRGEAHQNHPASRVMTRLAESLETRAFSIHLPMIPRYGCYWFVEGDHPS